MTSANKVKVILIQKISECTRPKSTRHPSVAFSPALNFGIRIRPKQITEETTIRNFDRSFNILYLIQSLQFRRETTVHTKYFVINECSYGQTVKAVSKYLPQPNIEPPFTFIVEPIYPVYLSFFMVSSQKMNFVGISYFVGQKQTYSLQTLLPSVNVVPQKQVVCSGRVAAIIK